VKSPARRKPRWNLTNSLKEFRGSSDSSTRLVRDRGARSGCGDCQEIIAIGALGVSHLNEGSVRSETAKRAPTWELPGIGWNGQKRPSLRRRLNEERKLPPEAVSPSRMNARLGEPSRPEGNEARLAWTGGRAQSPNSTRVMLQLRKHCRIVPRAKTRHYRTVQTAAYLLVTSDEPACARFDVDICLSSILMAATVTRWIN
jgi:hypothetical protein